MTEERRYTVAEIDALRRAVDEKWLFGSLARAFGPSGGSLMSRSYREEEKAKAVEERVRTHMLAGHTAADLYEAEGLAPPPSHFFRPGAPS